MFFQGLALSMLSPLVTRLTAHIGVTLTVFSSLIIARSLTYSLSSFLLGRLQRNISPNKLAAIGLLILPVVTFFYSRISGPFAVAVVFGIWGIANALTEGGVDIQNANLPEKFAARLNYLQYAAMSLGAIAGPVMLRFAMRRASDVLSIPFYAALPAVIFAVWILFLPEPELSHAETGKAGSSLTRAVVLAAVLMFFACGVDSALNSWSPTAVFRGGISDEANAALMPTFFAVGSLLSRLLNAMLIRNLRTETIFSCAVSMVMAAAAGMLLTRNYSVMLGLQFLFGFGNGAIFSSLLLLLRKNGSAGGGTVGFIMGMKNFGDMLISWGTGIVLDQKGSRACFAVLAAGAFLSFVMHLLILGTVKERSADRPIPR